VVDGDVGDSLGAGLACDRVGRLDLITYTDLVDGFGGAVGEPYLGITGEALRDDAGQILGQAR
jgi:hypothetical protein